MNDRYSYTSITKHLSCFFFIALLLILPVYSQAPTVNPSKAGMDAERLARIPLRMKAFVERGSIAGAVTLVARTAPLPNWMRLGIRTWRIKSRCVRIRFSRSCP